MDGGWGLYCRQKTVLTARFLDFLLLLFFFFLFFLSFFLSFFFSFLLSFFLRCANSHLKVPATTPLLLPSSVPCTHSAKKIKRLGKRCVCMFIHKYILYTPELIQVYIYCHIRGPQLMKIKGESNEGTPWARSIGMGYIIINRFYIALFSAIEQTHCARM